MRLSLLPVGYMRARSLSLAVLLLATTACLDPLALPVGRFGTISVAAYANGGSSYVIRPEAAFYDQSDLAYVPVVGDTCVVALYNPTTAVNPGLQTLNAGDFLFTRIGGRIDSMQALPNISLRFYTLVNPLGIPYTPGDTLSVTIPGAVDGFPATAISIRTAEAFTHGAIGVPAENLDLPVVWTAAPSAGSQMTFSLRYATGVSSGAANEQIFCSFTDDGSATIRAGYLDAWRLALDVTRSTRALRVRGREIMVDSRTRLSIISTFGQPLSSIGF